MSYENIDKNKDGIVDLPKNGRFESVETDRLSDSVRFLDPTGNVSEWQAVIDDVAANGGGTIIPKPGTYIVDSVITLKGGVVIDGGSHDSVTFRVADGLGGATPDVFEFAPGIASAGIRNIEVDGNWSNNTGGLGSTQWATDDGTSGAGIVMEDTENNNRMVRCFVENCHIHDTIRSPLVISGKRCWARNLELNDSATDHWLYLPHAIDCTVETVHCHGGARGEGIVIAKGGSVDTYNNELRDVHITNPQFPATENGSYPESLISYREDGGTGRRVGNTVDGCYVDATGTRGGRIAISQLNAVLRNLHFKGPQQYRMLQIDNSAESAHVDGVRCNITESNLGTSYLATIAANEVSVVNAEINESSGSFRGVQVTGDGGETKRVTLRDLQLNASNYHALRITGDNNPVTELSVENVQDTMGNRVQATGSYTYSDGTTLPCDVTQIDNLYRGRSQYNNGTVGTEGPCHYNGSNWISDVDGTTIA